MRGLLNLIIPKAVLECYLGENLTYNDKRNFKMLSVSQSTIYRRMRYYELSKLEFSEISDEDLDRQMADITKEFPYFGEGLIKQLLIGKMSRFSVGVYETVYIG